MPHNIKNIVINAQKFMQDNNIDGWLLYDYHGMNPIFRETVGEISNVTRPCWLWIPQKDTPELIVSYVDQNRFEHLKIKTTFWVSRSDMIKALNKTIAKSSSIAMEYSPMGELPRVSKIDGGTLELIRSIGVEIVSSGDLLQYATQQWDKYALNSHLDAANKLTNIVKQAFDYVGENIYSNITEFELAEFIRNRFKEENLESPDGPVVAVNAHAADPHFDPTHDLSVAIQKNDWLLIDLWARNIPIDSKETMYSDITWTAFVGDKVPAKQKEVFDTVIGGRDAAVSLIEQSHINGKQLQGWEIDKVSREFITSKGYGKYFSHRLGHSLGREVHSNAINLDSWETHDTRHFLPNIAVTIEPGIYLPGEFGVRSEINVFYYESGPEVTTEKQTHPYLITI
jgi:Xaa-Pro aminopeptidase